MGPLNRELEKRTSGLFRDLGFRITYQEYSPLACGDSIAVLQSDALRVRFVRDRGLLEVCVSSLSEPDRWIDLCVLWHAFAGYRPEPALEGWAWFIRDHFAELAEALGAALPQTRQLLDQREKEARTGVAHFIPRATPIGRLLRFRSTPAGMIVMGPLGWIVAALVIAYSALGR